MDIGHIIIPFLGFCVVNTHDYVDCHANYASALFALELRYMLVVFTWSYTHVCVPPQESLTRAHSTAHTWSMLLFEYWTRSSETCSCFFPPRHRHRRLIFPLTTSVLWPSTVALRWPTASNYYFYRQTRNPPQKRYANFASNLLNSISFTNWRFRIRIRHTRSNTGGIISFRCVVGYCMIDLPSSQSGREKKSELSVRLGVEKKEKKKISLVGKKKNYYIGSGRDMGRQRRVDRKFTTTKLSLDKLVTYTIMPNASAAPAQPSPAPAPKKRRGNIAR